MSVVIWLLTIALLALSPQFRLRHDRMSFDGERFVSMCAGWYQVSETWACVEVGR
jgi:hypothetical protein